MVLIDLSGPIADSEYLPELADAVGKVVDRLSDGQEVAVSAFDGAEEVAPFVGFGAAGDQVKALVDGLKKFKPRNRNTNFNGAIYQGLFALKEQLDASKAEQKSAALLVFTDRGPRPGSQREPAGAQAGGPRHAGGDLCGRGGREAQQRGADGHRQVRRLRDRRSARLQEGLRRDDEEGRRQDRGAIHLLVLLDQAPRRPQAGGRGGRPQGQGEGRLQVQRRRVQGGLHAQETPVVRGRRGEGRRQGGPRVGGRGPGRRSAPPSAASARRPTRPRTTKRAEPASRRPQLSLPPSSSRPRPRRRPRLRETRTAIECEDDYEDGVLLELRPPRTTPAPAPAGRSAPDRSAGAWPSRC